MFYIIFNSLNLCASSYSASLLFFCSCNRSYNDLGSYGSSGASTKIKKNIDDDSTIHIYIMFYIHVYI